MVKRHQKGERFVVYRRVSTDKQGRSGLGLDAQQAAVDGFLSGRPDATVLESFTEVESGKRNDRPELAKAMRRCRLTGATLLVAKLDRLSRSVRFLAELRESDVPFVAADLPEANTLTLSVMAAMAQHERELISERTRAGLAAAKARGVKLGNPNLSAVRNNDPSAAKAVQMARSAKRYEQLRELVDEIEAEHGEPMTLQQIADVLNDAGYQTARGARFSATHVLRIKRSAQAAAA